MQALARQSVGMSGNETGTTHPAADDDRPWKKLTWRGDVITMGEHCVSTASGVAADHEELKQRIREAVQYITRKQRSSTEENILPLLKRDFAGTILVGDEKHPGYFYDGEILELIRNPAKKEAELAIEKMADRLKLSEKTVLRYTKQRKKRRASRSPKIRSMKKPLR